MVNTTPYKKLNEEHDKRYWICLQMMSSCSYDVISNVNSRKILINSLKYKVFAAKKCPI